MELLSQFVSMRRAQLSDNTRNVHPTKIADEPLADLRGRELSERERERACDGRLPNLHAPATKPQARFSVK